MTALDGNHLDETVFGPPAHEAVPHGHSHQEPVTDPPPGLTHIHQHHHGNAGVHYHRHEHLPLSKVPEGDK